MSEHKNESDFEDLFADDDFAETEKSAAEEKHAEDLLNGEESLVDGSAGPNSNSSSSKKNSSGLLGLSKKDLVTYCVGGAIFFGVVYMVYRHFNPAVTVVKRYQGETRLIKSHPAPSFSRERANKVVPKAKPQPKPKPKVTQVKPKIDDNFVVNKKNLEQMIMRFTDSAYDIKDTQNSLVSKLNKVQNSVYKATVDSQKESQKEFLKVNQQLNLLAKKQSDLALKQQKQQLAEASAISSAVSKNSAVSYAKENNKALLGLTKQVSAISKSLASLKQSIIKTQVELKLIVAEKAAERQNMTLRAVVPGRAWLVDGKGRTITISVGTELPFYGKVLKIDSKSNTVTMNTGYIFS